MTPQGCFVWYELMANDTKAATQFYSEVLGWETEAWKVPPGNPPYTLWKNRGKPIGGVMDLPPETRAARIPSHWMGYVMVADTDQSLAQARKLGAETHVPAMDIPEVGRMAVIGDPQGAVVVLFTPKQVGSGPMPEFGEMGYVSWHELATDDWKKAWNFYEQMFGWKQSTGMDMGEMGIYQIFKIGDGPDVGAMFNRPPQIPVSNWLYYFRVPDLDKAIEKTRKAGGQILNGPMDVPGGRIAQCLDSQGAAFALHWTNEGQSS
jgi:predicted enzyme related to lactoylglutathione lyase